ncbi:SUMF1/EgtB/PvdO family nonheme iron enzyme [Nostoc sp. TCL26-01]|uniref:caspase, EACC1-associated type n=1 Tax=Nostoc sp. TCL26-01 TaxID=2576904 RepID=UPI0015BA21DE|nr:SUMF1/EgtB/PvdO family nonheme iron enzyme [Nostoc sp. TCL26-01]QLE57552.1 sulfatase-modifying factor protein [Nostoc sp. TCL26-01]
MAKVALLIGVSEYEPGLNALPSASQDVEAFQQVLIHPDMGEFAPTDVTVLINPSRQVMERAIYNLFTNRQKDDLVLFYFSGHGVKDENRHLYLSNRETTLENKRLIIPTAVSARYLHDRMNDSKSQRQVIILDCCFSGAFPDGFMPKSDSSVDIETQLGAKGRAILTSSTSLQYSFEQEGSELSIYTRYLVEGIEKGAADLDEDGWISVDELHNYASRKVIETSPAMTPQFYPVKEGYRIKLAKAPIGDPQLKYRQEVNKRANQGKFSIPARRLLNSLRTQLQLTLEIAEAIEAEVLQPYLEFQRKLQEYEEVLDECVKAEYPLNEITLNDLQAYQQHLGLTDENIAPIHQRILPITPPPAPPLQGEGSLTSPFLDIPLPDIPQETAAQPLLQEDESPTPPFPLFETLRERREGGLGGLGQFAFDVVTVNVEGKETNRQKGQAEYFTADLGNGVALDMVSIPGGEFWMGSPDGELKRIKYESPQHKVTVQPFFMGKFPVTQAQWRAVAALPKVSRDLEADPSRFKGANRPVERVSWLDATEFCARLSQKLSQEFRLPSEAEWEYACRAGTTTPFHFGETITTDLANYRGTDWEHNRTVYSGSYGKASKGVLRGETTDVGSFALANTFGLYDMHGLVWEWCLDYWHDNYQDAPTDGSPWLVEGQENDNYYRLLRGGSWNLNPGGCRSAYRDRYSADNRFNGLGFRVVLVSE